MLWLISACSARCGKRRWEIGWGDPMGAPRREIALPSDAKQRQRLVGDFSVSDRAHEPCRTGADYSGLFGGPVGLCRGAHAWGDAADSDTMPGASGGTWSGR